MTTRERLCVVCAERPASEVCEPCWRSRGKSKEGLMAWAARRARAFERRRAKKAADALDRLWREEFAKIAAEAKLAEKEKT